MPDIFWHCQNGNYAINLCNSTASNMSEKAPQLSRYHEANGFKRISGAVAGECSVRSVKNINHLIESCEN